MRPSRSTVASAAVGRAEDLRIVVPGTAADDTPTAISPVHAEPSLGAL